MGLMGTLAKVAIGYAAARGVDKLSGGGGLGAMLGGGAQVRAQNPAAAAQGQMGKMLSGQMPEGAANPLQGMMDMLGQAGGGAGGANPMAAMMEKMQSGGFDLSAMMGGGGGTASDGKGLLSALGGGGAGMAGMFAALGGAAASAQGQGVAGLLDAFGGGQAAPEAEEAAGLMLRAMIQAAKSDGGIDEAEKAKILETIGDADPEDMAFINAQLAAPVDPVALGHDTPQAQRMQVYSASLMTIRVDTQAEANYLDQLAKAMALDEPTVNALHMQMGMQPLYA